MRYYVSGPIAGAKWIPHEDKIGWFHYVTNRLIADGHEALNPLTVEACFSKDCNGEQIGKQKYEHTWECYLKYDIIRFLEVGCDAIMLLPHWQESKGARLEKHIAEELGMKVEYWPVEAA